MQGERSPINRDAAKGICYGLPRYDKFAACEARAEARAALERKKVIPSYSIRISPTGFSTLLQLQYPFRGVGIPVEVSEAEDAIRLGPLPEVGRLKRWLPKHKTLINRLHKDFRNAGVVGPAELLILEGLPDQE